MKLTRPEDRAAAMCEKAEFPNVRAEDLMVHAVRAALKEVVEVFGVRTEGAVAGARKFRQERFGLNAIYDGVEEATVSCVIAGLKHIVNEALPDGEKIGEDHGD